MSNSQMGHTNRGRSNRVLPIAAHLLAAVLLVATASGCVNLFAHLVSVGMGNTVPPRFRGLEEKRVAVVCLSGSSAFGPSTAAGEIARSVSHHLKTNVTKIDVISQQEIADWMDRNDWNQIDYRELGEGVGAEMVVAVDLASFSLHEGKTLFRGRSELGVTVYDIIQGGNVVFDVTPPTIVYPATTGQHSADTTESAFRRKFVEIVAHRIARNFYAYDATSDFGQDALVLD